MGQEEEPLLEKCEPEKAGNICNSFPSLIFVSGYHDLPGVSEGEWLEYYFQADCDRMRSALGVYLQHHLDLFSDSYDYADYFSSAEYEDPEDVLRDEEVPIFRSALARDERDAPFRELAPRDVLSGYRAVLFRRVRTGDFETLLSAVNLFNGIIESAIEGLEFENPRCVVGVETAKDFGPRYVDGLLASIEWAPHPRTKSGVVRFVGSKLAPFRPLLDALHPVVHDPAWPRSEMSVGRLLAIVDFHREILEEWDP